MLRPLPLLLAVALLGCSRNESSPTPPSLPQLTRGSATISGTVTLLGTPPEMKSQSVACDPAKGAAKIVHTDKTVRVSATGGLADTYVFITASSAHPTLKGSGADEPAKVLDQVGCDFIPHTLALQVGQPLKLRNSDPTFHNVHWDPKLNRPLNVGFGPAPTSPERIVALTAPEFIAVRCDVHPWMTSQIGVFDHPFFAVTNEAGQYTIPALPPGTYTLTTHHPYYGPGTPQTLTIPPTTDASTPAPTTANFVYDKSK